jgi:hypothetical protein
MLALGRGPLLAVVLFATAPFDASGYDKALVALEAKRVALGQRFGDSQRRAAPAPRSARKRGSWSSARSPTPPFPAWMGTPWGLGPSSTASRPHEPGKVVGCSYFVTGVLQNAGLRLSSRGRFAQAPSLLMQQALTSDPAALHRYGNLEAAELRKRLLALGDGLYIVGLNIHTGFLLVRAGEVRVIHASYAPPNQVVESRSSTPRSSRCRGLAATS